MPASEKDPDGWGSTDKLTVVQIMTSAATLADPRRTSAVFLFAGLTTTAVADLDNAHPSRQEHGSWGWRWYWECSQFILSSPTSVLRVASEPWRDDEATVEPTLWMLLHSAAQDTAEEMWPDIIPVGT